MELVQRPNVNPSQIVFQDRSIGGAVAADLSRYCKPAAMILSSTFIGLKEMFWEEMFWEEMFWEEIVLALRDTWHGRPRPL
ncbi:MAG: hypothetical protein N838_32600 [Thiohalocapsa sp. PB-PSB1]|jgi:hypothetical protein|nr:MAG: hypothetical protein N838_18565 [Thiohalocapsa sp. PB-PSB1]QQO57389.1 MAG: hypothetical protein N838_32600 [Thiohalocapsa sp. PB-PSB1]HCS91549.1 hypothetical protein [Chromatiaceae bacterium]